MATFDDTAVAEVLRHELLCYRFGQMRRYFCNTRSAFAARFSVPRVRVGQYESGEAVPTLPMLVRICRATGCSVDWLYGRTKSMFREGINMFELNNQRLCTDFARRIRKLRESRRETQQQFGVSVGVEGKQICKYETGKALPSAETLYYICVSAGCSMDWLVGLSDEFYPRRDKRP